MEINKDKQERLYSEGKKDDSDDDFNYVREL